MLHAHLLNNTMEFDNKCFLQTSGIPMGRAWAPAVANIFLNYWEVCVWEKLASLNIEPPKFFKRFLDDILLVANSQEHATTLLEVLGSTLPCIRIGSSQIGVAVNYLDVELSLVANTSPNNRLPFASYVGICRVTYPNEQYRIESRLYRKPTDLVVLLDFWSAHTLHTKLGVVFGQMVRICRISTNVESAGFNIRRLLELMIVLRNFPPKWRRMLHIRILKYLVSRVLQHTTHNNSVCVKNIQQGKIHMLLPLQVDIRFFSALFRDLNSRMNGLRLCARNECTPNLLRILTHISV
jgi:hypothetical protein